jgi:glutamine amidotransferase
LINEIRNKEHTLQIVMIAIVDYEMGNLRSVQKGFESVGHEASITRDPAVIDSSSHVVLPGVGAFGDCVRNLNRFDLVEPIRQSISRGKPFLGICLGLQVLFTESEEFGAHQGLGIFKGKVKRFSFSDHQGNELKIPHMGWNSINIAQPSPLLNDIAPEAYVYFVHSYYVEPIEKKIICTETTYGIPFVSSIAYENIFACQFHPEKSQRIGLQLLRNFGALN